jgi:hypothetical protein
MGGRNIRAGRRAKGLSLFMLPERSDLSADFIGKVERGTSPSVEVIIQSRVEETTTWI